MTATLSLSPVQRGIVEQPVDTPAMLIDAGPGSGKTRVLGERIRWLLEQGVPAEQIIALTFTNQAAQELRARLADISTDVRAQTLHAYAHHLLREKRAEWGRGSPFQVIAALDQVRILQRVFVDELGWDCSESLASNVLKQISHRKRLGLEIGGHQYYQKYGHSQLEIERVDGAYCLANQRSNALDFDDLIAEAARGLQSERAEEPSPIWLFVDEFHDISLDQYDLIRLIAPPESVESRLFAIWDRRQSIYRFRGADSDRVAVRLNADYQPLHLRMQENYRSATKVVQSANALIPTSKSPDLMASRIEPGQVVVVECASETTEAEAIVNLVRRRLETDRPGSIAVLYAKHERGDRIERVLSRENIPVRRVTGRSLSTNAAMASLETLLKFHAGIEQERDRYLDLCLELGTMPDELDFLGITTDEHRRFVSGFELEDVPPGFQLRLDRINALLDRVDALHGFGTLKQLGEAIIEEVSRSELPCTLDEFEEMIASVRDEIASENLNEAIPDRTFVAIDIEATTKYPESARIIEIAAVRFDRAGARIGDPFNVLIRGVGLSAKIVELTHISQTELDAGEEMDDALLAFRRWIDPEDVVVGHNIGYFDLPVINRHLVQHGLDRLTNEVFDTLPMARRFYRHQSRRLEDLAETLGFPARSHHRALADVEATIDLFTRLVEDRRWRLAVVDVLELGRPITVNAARWELVREHWHRIVDLAPPDHELTDLLNMLAIVGDDARNSSSDSVQLMTIHASKGLEWDTVILAGIEDDLFPFGSNPTSEDFEEARRLLYVGITRARERLAIFHAQYRDGVPKHPSRFLRDLPADPEIVFRRSLKPPELAATNH